MVNLASQLNKIEHRLKGLSLFEKMRKSLAKDEPSGARKYVAMEEKIFDLDFLDKKTTKSHEESITFQEWVKYFWNRFHFDVQDDLTEAESRYQQLDKLKKELFDKRVITQWR